MCLDRMKTLKLTIFGKVQGVFYRENTKKKALELGITGTVRNTEEKTVELIAQGPEDKIKKLIEFCKDDPGYSRVTDINIEEIKKEEFTSFEILF